MVTFRAGVLVKPASSIDLANALERLLADPVARAALADTGRRRIERDFDGALIADRLVALMERGADGCDLELPQRPVQ